jgi:hypothetical protein
VTEVQARRFRRSRRWCSRSSFVRSSSAALVLAALFAGAERPAAAIENQQHLGISPVLGILSVDKKSTSDVGAGGAVYYAYGLNDQWNLAIDLSSVEVAANQKQDTPTAPRDRPAAVHTGTAGVSYVIDILRWVPWLSVEGGVDVLHGGTLANTLILPEVNGGAGLDYQISRTFAVGVAGREHFMISKLDTYPSYLTLTARLEVMWGY